MFAYLIASGISTGALYAMVAIGLVLVYRSTGHINFSHGELFMFGGFIAYTCFVILGMPYFVSLVVAVIGGFALGVLCDRTVYRPLIKAPALTMVLATVGFSFLIKGGRALLLGRPGRRRLRGVPRRGGPLTDPGRRHHGLPPAAPRARGRVLLRGRLHHLLPAHPLGKDDAGDGGERDRRVPLRDPGRARLHHDLGHGGRASRAPPRC